MLVKQEEGMEAIVDRIGSLDELRKAVYRGRGQESTLVDAYELDKESMTAKGEQLRKKSLSYLHNTNLTEFTAAPVDISAHQWQGHGLCLDKNTERSMGRARGLHSHSRAGRSVSPQSEGYAGL